ncbi:sugar kinase [Devosia marina]|uniref:Sugar kinase n=1 Tax=Devosia marina TaxID=2683198 RepID=A0A7X3FPG3_9HYPH|nr:sugar kinase [Devosia marina]MVS98369.1 sugar kinase [Devosia marina]
MLFVSIGECMVEMSEAGDDRYRLGFAGDTLNTAWYARARLPAQWQVEYYTGLGTDVYSDRIRAFLNENNIGTRFVREVPDRRPGLYLIHQAEGDRRFTYWRGQSAARLLADDPPHLINALNGADVVYFSGISLAILAPQARRTLIDCIASAKASRKMIVAFDPNIRMGLWDSEQDARDTIMQVAAIADFAFPTWGDETVLFGDPSLEVTAARYLDAGCGHVVVKNGAGTAFATTCDHQARLAPSPHTKVVDATGAGDSFNGAYLAAFLTGAKVTEALQQAHDVAGKVVGHTGALMPQSLVRSDPTWRFMVKHASEV